MKNNKKFQAASFFGYVFWLLTFCYVVFLWATDSPYLLLGVLYGIAFSAIVWLITVLFKIEELNEQKIPNPNNSKKSLKFSSLDLESFENLLIRLFGAMGYIVECAEVEKIKAFVLYKNKNKAFVMFDCNNSQNDAIFIKQIKAGIKSYNCQKGIYVCTAKISKKATEMAKAKNIDIVDKKYLQELLISYLNETWN